MAASQAHDDSRASAPARPRGMSDDAIVAVVRAPALIGGVLGVAGSAVIIAVTDVGSWYSSYQAFMAVLSIFFAVFVWLVIPNQPRNAVVWTMASSAFFAGLSVAGRAAAALLVDDPSIAMVASPVPATLPDTASWILMFTEGSWAGALVPLLTLGLILFPDGRWPSSRWRWVGAFAMVIAVMTWATSAWSNRPGGQGSATDPILGVTIWIFLLALVLSFICLVNRFRSSRGATREQFKWIVWGASIFVPALIFAIVLGDTSYEDLGLLVLMVGEAAFLASYGIAVGKYRLFDIDVVISRTFVVAGLAAFVTAVYGILVGGVVLLFGAGTDATLPLVIAATVVVAIAFQPLRERMRSWADRLVYGERATPYEVLSRFSERMRDAVATEELIPQMAQLITQGTGARRATVWMEAGKELRPVATWPEEESPPAPVASNSGAPNIPGVDHIAVVEHDAERLGAVTVAMPRGESLTATDVRLIDDVASQAGLVLRNARLTADLVATIAQLRGSRQRLVAAQDEERRRLERDLHDGAQQQIIAIKMKVAAARQMADRGDDTRAADLLEQVLMDTDDAVASLRNLAHGIYPPLLEAEGLTAALRGRTATAPVPVSIMGNGVGRYVPEVEAAVYFCVLESVQNAIKHAEARRVEVGLLDEGTQLVFTVSDEGKGFDPTAQPPGRGLVNIADRLDALGGSLDLQSTPGAGTTVRGALPAERQSAPD